MGSQEDFLKEHPFAALLFTVFFWYLLVSGIIWSVRNPTANQWTNITRLPHVLRFERLAEYQVVETHKSIGPVGEWTGDMAKAVER